MYFSAPFHIVRKAPLLSNTKFAFWWQIETIRVLDWKEWDEKYSKNFASIFAPMFSSEIKFSFYLKFSRFVVFLMICQDEKQPIDWNFIEIHIKCILFPNGRFYWRNTSLETHESRAKEALEIGKKPDVTIHN